MKYHPFYGWIFIIFDSFSFVFSDFSFVFGNFSFPFRQLLFHFQQYKRKNVDFLREILYDILYKGMK